MEEGEGNNGDERTVQLCRRLSLSLAFTVQSAVQVWYSGWATVLCVDIG